MRIQNNVSAINAHRYYGINQTNATKSIAKLSSGYRINSAADDAAGLAISEKMRSQIRGLTMASKNAQDAVSLIQTAEGGLQEIDNMVQRIRELVVYASNDTQDYDGSGSEKLGDRQKIQDEINSLSAEIDSMAGRVEFNKKKLIDGSLADPTETINNLNSSLATLQAKRAAVYADANPASFATEVTTYAAAQTAYAAAVATYNTALSTYNGQLDTYNTAVETFNTAETTFLAAQATYQAADPSDTTAAATFAAAAVTFAAAQTAYATANTNYGTQLDTYNTALGNYNTAVATYDTATTTFKDAETKFNESLSAVTKYDAQIESISNHIASIAAEGRGTDLYFQVGANANQKLVMNIGSVKTNSLGIGDGSQDATKTKANKTIDVVEATGSQITGMLDTLDQALSYVTTERSKLGAAQNRLEYTMNSLDISAENIQSAESRIRDVDMAKEMTNFTKLSILFQASTAMLAQANAFPQGVLQLLG
jgi:flagellin